MGQPRQGHAATMMRRLIMLWTMALAAHLPGLACGHEARPAYLELRQTGAESWRVLWKVPAQGEMRLAIQPRFPQNCAQTGEPITSMAGGAYVERTAIRCQGGLAGRALGIDGLGGTMTDVLVRTVRSGGSQQVARLTPRASSVVIEAAPGRLQVARTYLVLGVEHILDGVDHLLFVLGLLLLVQNRWMLVKTITAFTVAHSFTLALATMGWLQVPQMAVEAVIALSILFLASELARQGGRNAGLMQRYPWIVAFMFGLLHGLGFAGALREVGLPEGEIPLALLSFNVGVEIGQLMFVGTVLLALATLRRLVKPIPSWAHRLPVYGIGSMAAFWSMQRMAPLF